MIPHSRPVFDPSFSEPLQSVLATGHTASGTQARSLEQTIMQYIGCHDAVAVDSGTSALMLAIRALSLQMTIKYVGIPAYACTSLLFAVRAAGCIPICMDCKYDLRLDADKAWDISNKLDAVILVHPFGMIEPMVKEAWTCPVIEDIAQAAGAMLDGKPVGSFGDLAITSFYATKAWGGAYGGMVMGNQNICTHVRAMSNPDNADFTQNYVGHHQLSDVHASLALSRFACHEKEITQRKQQITWLNDHLPRKDVESIAHRTTGNAFRYIIRTQTHADATIKHLRQHGIGACKPVQQPLNLATDDVCKGALQAWKDCVSLPLLPSMNHDEYKQYEHGLKACLQY